MERNTICNTNTIKKLSKCNTIHRSHLLPIGLMKKQIEKSRIKYTNTLYKYNIKVELIHQYVQKAFLPTGLSGICLTLRVSFTSINFFKQI